MTGGDFWSSDEPWLPGGGPDDLRAWVRGQPGLTSQVLFETSGTTGVAKWVGLTRAALRASAEVVNAHLGVDERDVWGLALPERHVGGFGVLARAHFSGTRVARFAGKWDARSFADWLAGEQVTLVSLVPTQVVDLVAAGVPAPRWLRAVVVGGGELAVGVGMAARRLGWPVLASFGMTETGSQVATMPLAQLGDPFTSAPLPLLPCWDARLAPSGLLELRGAPLFSGYVVRTATGGWRHQPRTAGWFTTNDRAELAGRLVTPLGRSDRRVKVLGELVDLDALEVQLAVVLPGCGETWKIVDVPEPRRGCLLALATTRPADDNALHTYQSGAGALGRLAAVVAVDALPRTPLGKLRLGELRELVAGKLLAGGGVRLDGGAMK